MVYKPHVQLAWGKARMFSVHILHGPRAWNSLPPALRSTSTSFTTFKKELKSFLFGLSFCLWQRIPFIDYVQRSSSSLYRM